MQIGVDPSFRTLPLKKSCMGGGGGEGRRREGGREGGKEGGGRREGGKDMGHTYAGSGVETAVSFASSA